MVSMHGYFQYQHIIQADPIPQEEKCIIHENSITGFIHKNNYKLFGWMIKLAEMELKMGNEQFDSTLFLVNDENLRKQFGQDDQFFLSMDKHKAVHIINAHLLNRKIYPKTLMSQRLTKLFTKNESTQIMCLHNKGSLTFNNMANLLSSVEVGNGVIHLIDRLLLPVF